MSTERPVPDPPDPDALDPLVETWEAGRPLFRCHDVRFGATEFNPGAGRGRFHPFVDAAGNPVPTLYLAETLDGVLSETVFHAVPAEAPAKIVRRSSLLPLLVSTLAAGRPLALGQLHGYGLQRIGARRRDLIDSEATDYPATTAWARALHRSRAPLDGLVWISRLFDTSRAVVLFGDRVARDDLQVVEHPLPLYRGIGLKRVQAAAEQAGITLSL